MKYYSEILGEFYDTEQEVLDAEAKIEKTPPADNIHTVESELRQLLIELHKKYPDIIRDVNLRRSRASITAGKRFVYALGIEYK